MLCCTRFKKEVGGTQLELLYTGTGSMYVYLSGVEVVKHQYMQKIIYMYTYIYISVLIEDVVTMLCSVYLSKPHTIDYLLVYHLCRLTSLQTPQFSSDIFHEKACHLT